MNHQDTVIDQFTRQAEGFATAPAMNDAGAIELMLQAADPGPADVALDVACGPGIVAAALARRVQSVTGVDVTACMVELAERRCADAGLSNTAFEVGDVTALPFADGSFSLVVCRYALHHFPEPARVVGEMARVCTPGGRVVLVDIDTATDPAVAARFDAMEQARDPSHVRALTAEKIAKLLADEDLQVRDGGSYTVPVRLDSLLARSASPDPARVEQILEAALAGEPLGVGERWHEDTILFEYPITVQVGWKR